jgi:hypothetical protein
MSHLVRVLMVYAAPIPVGHRVELRRYVYEWKGLFGSGREDRPYEPIVYDLDTGIEYASDHAYECTTSIKAPDQPVALAPAPRGQVVAVLRGVVRACRVLHLRRWQGFDVQTELDIEPIA